MDSNTQQFKLLLTLKLRQLHNSGYDGITYEDLHRMFTTFVWKQGVPTRLSQLADDVLNVSEEDVVIWLANESKVAGYRASLADFESLFSDGEPS